MPKKRNIVDRILNGEMDTNVEITDDIADPDPDGTDDVMTDEGEPTADSEPYGDEEDDEEVFEDPTDTDDDLPDEEYCLEYMETNGIEIVPEPPEPVGAKYSKFRDTEETANKEQPKVNTKKTAIDAPKNATTPTPAAETTETKTTGRRGRPSKLIGKETEVVQMYQGQTADKQQVSAADIAEKFGVSISCVLNCLRAQGVEIRPKGRRKSD